MSDEGRGLPAGRSVADAPAFALGISLSAFLLFLVQPIVAREILPWFGGAAAVWTTCVLFFQVLLLAGYAYAHWLVRSDRRWVHALLLAASIAMSRIVPAAGWKPVDGADPLWRILGLLATTVGLPYFCLTCTSPLLQAWYVRRHPGQLPYRFFALSNLASMVALLGYPVLIEPHSSLHQQSSVWSGAFVLSALLNGWLLWHAAPESAAAAAARAVAAAARPRWGVKLRWAALAACPSALLLAVTNHVSQNIAAIPLLWVVPLAAYLLSFIVTFESARWYRRGPLLVLFCVALVGMAYASAERLVLADVRLLVSLLVLGLFLCCMACHGELARSKPAPQWLTGFYLWVALGGALGALFVAVLAPLCFPAMFELPIALIVTPAVVLGTLIADRTEDDATSAYLLAGVRPGQTWGPRLALVLGAWLALAGYLARAEWVHLEDARLAVRNFYGALRVMDHRELGVRVLVHGTINHGEQYLAADRRRRPITYYGPATGVGRLVAEIERRGPIRLGVIGLGAGTMAAWARAGDSVRFYEINPAVLGIARTEFSYLGDSPAAVTVVLGDARLSLEREPPERFDVLVVDAFSGDSIPVHLLTREAVALYRRHLAPDGVLAIHITNTYLDLAPPLLALAEELGLEARDFENPEDLDTRSFGSRWLLLGARDGTRLRWADAAPARPGAAAGRAGARVWTDDYSNLWGVLRR